MKILAIIGTPTREEGFTTKSVQVLENSFRAQRDVEFEYVYLADAALGGCVGKLTCVKFGEQQCPFAPQMDPLLEKFSAADLVIFASPVHCFNVSTLMKNMIDLLVYQMHRPGFFGKKAIVVATAAGAGQGGVLNYLKKTVANWGFDVVGKLGVHAGFFGEDKYMHKLEAACDKVATQAFKAVDEGRLPNPGLAELINFRVWRSTVTRTGESSPYDWSHWESNGWLKQNYYYPARSNPLSVMMAGLVEKIIAYAIRNASVKPIT